MAQKLEYTVLGLIEDALRTIKASPVNLGGTGGDAGGVGGPPGGFIGQIPQNRVTYDTTEAATLSTLPSGLNPPSGWSLVDNLNHIRYRLGVVESGILIVDDWDGTPTIQHVHEITFSGATVTQLGAGHALVVFSGGGLDTTAGDARYSRKIVDTSLTPTSGSTTTLTSSNYQRYYADLSSLSTTNAVFELPTGTAGDIIEVIISGDAPSTGVLSITKASGATLDGSAIISVTMKLTGESYSFVNRNGTDWRTARVSKKVGTTSSNMATGDRGVTNGDTHDHNGGDGAQIDHVNVANKGTNTHSQIDTFIAGWTPSWTAVASFSNSWVNFGAGGYGDAAYWKDPAGRVYLRGLIKNGTVGNVAAFNLPAGYRPPYNMEFAVISNGALGDLAINTTGDVKCLIGNNTYFELDGVSFSTI